MKTIKVFGEKLALLLVWAVVVLYFCAFTINQSDKAIIQRLGKLQLNSERQLKVLEPGLHFKLPFIDVVKTFDTRLNLVDIMSKRVLTAEKKIVEVDFYVQWRIEDLGLFFRRTNGSIFKVEELLRNKAEAGLVIEFGRLNITQVVASERQDLMGRLRDYTSISAKDMGISVHDFRVKRINFPDEVSGSVYERMRAERQRIANEYRADGQKAAVTIRAEADKKVKILLAEAKKIAQEIKAEGEAKAAAIYAEAYNQDPSFYSFYRSIEAYKNSFAAKSDLLLLKPETEFLKHLYQQPKAQTE